MAKICYIEKNFRRDNLELIDKINSVEDWDRIYDMYV